MFLHFWSVTSKENTTEVFLEITTPYGGGRIQEEKFIPISVHRWMTM